jgi:hypothetical protein
MNSLFDDSLLQSHSNSDPLLTGNDPSAFNHESHNDLFNQNLLSDTYQHHDSYQENVIDNTQNTTNFFDQEFNALTDDVFGNSSNDDSNNQSITTPLFEHHAHPHYEPIHSWDNAHLGFQKSQEIVFHSERVDHIHSGTVNHPHYWKKNEDTSSNGEGDSSDNSNAPIFNNDDSSSSCLDNNQDGVCDSNSCGDSGSSSCGSDSSDSSN